MSNVGTVADTARVDDVRIEFEKDIDTTDRKQMMINKTGEKQMTYGTTTSTSQTNANKPSALASSKKGMYYEPDNLI